MCYNLTSIKNFFGGDCMKYFCVSDIHGHFNVLIDCLREAGWNMEDELHHLIVIGDMTDRGPQNKEVLEFIAELVTKKKATLIMGNHDIFLRSFFEGDFSRTGFDIEMNGHGYTLSQLLGKEITVDSDFKYESKILNKKYPHIRNLLSTDRYYLELGDYIFVHGGINGSLDNWREDTVRNFTWNKQHTLKGVKGKTIVCGHIQNITIREPKNYKTYLKDPFLYLDKFGILYRDGVIHIDGSVCTTNRINVLVLDIDNDGI